MTMTGGNSQYALIVASLWTASCGENQLRHWNIIIAYKGTSLRLLLKRGVRYGRICQGCQSYNQRRKYNNTEWIYTRRSRSNYGSSSLWLCKSPRYTYAVCNYVYSSEFVNYVNTLNIKKYIVRLSSIQGRTSSAFLIGFCIIKNSEWIIEYSFPWISNSIISYVPHT